MEIAIAAGGSFLSASLQVLFERLASFTLQERGSLHGIGGDNLQKLSNTVLKIRSIVAGIDERWLSKDPALSMWLRELKDVAYDAEDELDSFATELLQKRVESQSNLRSFIVIGRDKIERIQNKLKGIAHRWDELRQERPYNHGSSSNLNIIERPSNWETSSLTGDNKVLGRAAEKEEIVGLLLRCNTANGSLCLDSKPFVLPIVGMGGLGKSALAQLVYNDPRIQQHFDLKMWIWVSEEFDVTRITRVMLALNGEICPKMETLEILQNKLACKLERKKFLLVLDDVWNEDQSHWSRLCSPLLFGGQGSVILVTTRSTGVADAMQSTEPLYLEELSLEGCWSIFKHQVFSNGNYSNMPRKLEAMSREIVKKAGGVPLAVKTLSGLLYRKTEEWRWRGVLEADTWALPQGEHGILTSLRRSYHHLPNHLKRCFAYLSLFPKKYVFDKRALVQMWIAQSFIQATQSGQSMEEVGSDYFDELVSRSMVAPSATGYVMHDLLHDLSKIISTNECLCIEKNEPENLWVNDQSIRHLSFTSNFRFDMLYGFKNARTLLNLSWVGQLDSSAKLSSWPFMGNDLNELLNKLKLLRTLDLSYSEIFYVPNSIGSLKNLRYLDLSNTFIEKLPSSCCKLYNLQTLRLKGCILKNLPRGITNLLNLRHLVADAGLVSNIIGIGKLTSLQELEVFRISKEKGCKVKELMYMNELRGRLSIKNLQDIDCRKVQSDILKRKLHLCALEMEWDYDSSPDTRDSTRATTNQEILEILEPPPNLKDLNIKGYCGIQFPNWMNTVSMRNLESIIIIQCKKVKFLPCLGELPYLKHLYIERMESIQCIGTEFSGSRRVSFPQLESLHFSDMPQWIEWLIAAEGDHFPFLKELIVDTCPKLKACSLPLSEELRFLQIKGCPGVVNKSLFVMLQNQKSMFFSMKINFLTLESCIEEVLFYLTKLKYLKVQYYEEEPSPIFNKKGPISLTYSLYPEGDGDYPSEAELEIFRCSSNSNINSSDDNISSLLECIVERLKLMSCFVIQGCPDVSSLHLENVLCHLDFLEEIEISSSRKMQELKWLHESLKPLKVLRFQDCPDIVCLPRKSLRCQSSLEKLLIEGCGELVSLEVQDLIMLETIIIQRCPKLTNTTFSTMLKSPLQVLSVDATSLLSARLVQNLSSLQRVTIQKCSLVSFSKEEEAGLQCIPFLQHLELTDCPQLQYLPAELHKLWSLRSLSILCCPLVQALPSMGLPSSLQRFEITDCPKLIKRCERENGPDWPLIARIPFIKMYPEEAITNQLL